jgi:hypothetical protein
LQLLGQIAQGSPDTLRIFAARRSRLQLLKGRLGPFGLFRTLSYPIDAQELLSALALARAAREIDPPALKIRHVVIEERQAGEVPATLENEALPLRVPHVGASMPSPAAVRPSGERISLTSADALFSINVPMTIAAMRGVRRSESSRVPQPAPVAGQASGRKNAASQLAQRQHTAQQSALPLPATAQSAAPSSLPSRSEAFERALARREAARRAANSQVVSRPSRQGRKLAEASGRRKRSLAQTPPLGSLSELGSLVTAAHPTHRPQLARATPKRSMVLLGGAMVAVFLVATLAFNRFDAAAGTSSSPQATRISPLDEQPVISAPPQNPMPASPTPSVRPAQSAAKRAEVKPDPKEPDVDDPDTQMAASSTPTADPSSFGSEAYEAIYPN